MRRLLQRRLHPCIVLQHVGENVAMEQRRALGDAGGAAGILQEGDIVAGDGRLVELHAAAGRERVVEGDGARYRIGRDRKSTRLNSSHGYISYAVFCLKKK